MGTISGMRLTIKYVIKDVDRYGVERWYYRAPGCKKIKLPSPEAPEFFEALSAAKAAAQPGPRVSQDETTLRWLCSAYFESGAFSVLDDKTKHVRRLILDKVLPRYGALPFKTIGSEHVLAWRDERKDKPEAANAIVKALRQVFRWAKEAKHVRVNPASEVAYLPSSNPDGFHTWTPEEVKLFIARHPRGTKAYLALHLLMFGGGRRSDVVRMGKQQVDGGAFRYVAFKGRGNKRTRTERFVPLIPALQDAIAAGPCGEMVYLVTSFGRAFTNNGFGNWFKDRCKEAGLPHCSAHGLRKAAAVQAAEAGCTEQELMAMFGWSSPKQAAVYTRKVNRAKLSQSGTDKIVQLLSRK